MTADEISKRYIEECKKDMEGMKTKTGYHSSGDGSYGRDDTDAD